MNVMTDAARTKRTPRYGACSAYSALGSATAFATGASKGGGTGSGF